MNNYEKDYAKIVKQPPKEQRGEGLDKVSLKKYSRLRPVEISYSNRLEAVHISTSH